MAHSQSSKKITFLLVAGLMTASCSSESNDAVELRAQPAELLELEEPFEEPFQVAIDRRVGATGEQVREAVLSARADTVQRCLVDAGFALGITQVRDIVATDTLEGSSLLEVSLQQLEMGTPWVDVGAPPTQIVECLDQAEAAINPQYDLTRLLHDATMSISRRLEKHPEMITAMRRERACVTESSLPDYGVAALAGEDMAVADIMAAIHAEELSVDDGVWALRSLLDQRGDLDAALEEVEACAWSRMKVERKLVVEQQQQWLTANPDWIDDVANRYAIILEPLAVWL